MNILLVALFLAAVLYVIVTALNMVMIYHFSGLIRPIVAAGMAFKPWLSITIIVSVLAGLVFGVYWGVTFLMSISF